MEDIEIFKKEYFELIVKAADGFKEDIDQVMDKMARTNQQDKFESSVLREKVRFLEKMDEISRKVDYEMESFGIVEKLIDENSEKLDDMVNQLKVDSKIAENFEIYNEQVEKCLNLKIISEAECFKIYFNGPEKELILSRNFSSNIFISSNFHDFSEIDYFGDLSKILNIFKDTQINSESKK